jgi:hypothetical protein
MLAEIEQAIRPLSRAEKWRLIEDIQHMLKEEEGDPAQHFEKGIVYPVFTPLGMEEGAAKLQEYLDQGKL